MRGAATLALACAFWVVCSMGAATAPAMTWTVAPGESRVLFDYERNGQAAEGRFARFSGGGTFDQSAPGEATLEMRIDSASIDLDDKLASAFATSAEWFDSVNHPDVVYRLQRLSPEGGDRYRAEGELTIRGKTRPIVSTITLAIDDGTAHATGSLDLDRTDYWLGVGPTALFVRIGRQVSVRFDLTAHPVQ